MEQNRNIVKVVLMIILLVLIFGVYGWGRSGYYTRDLPDVFVSLFL